MAMEGANTISSAVDLSNEDKLRRSLSLFLSLSGFHELTKQETHEASLDKWKLDARQVKMRWEKVWTKKKKKFKIK